MRRQGEGRMRPSQRQVHAPRPPARVLAVPARESVTAADAPASVGPYVHAVRVGNLLFCSGQIPLDPRTGQLVAGTVADQTGRCLENLAAVCHSVGATLGDSVRLTVYTTEMDLFGEINEVYESFFESD